MEIKNAKYIKDTEVREVDGELTEVSVGDNMAITASVNGKKVDFIPLDPDNMHYAKILELVKSGDLTIADAD
tara:strand:- start:125 stop:340 length:216 start_codon:yes stop_codon:yes gene_type:complete